ncbi:MAG TPA: glycosyltransferase, partial [Candidatus Methylomirabilis sp.]|nr:glycosyltransferase [Candidatus Methylomirabilis sp.]
AFGVCHFTWDWTFDKIFGQKKFVKLLEAATHEAEAIFFPPFTPDEIIEKYNGIAVRVPFVVYPFSKIDMELPNDKINVLVLDSGTRILSEIIEKNTENFKKLNTYNFIRVNDSNKVHNLIPYADLVISRAGFNTISDCINAKTPMLLIEEKGNPEIEHNLSRVSELGLCGRMSVNDYAKNFVTAFERFIRDDYQEVLDTTKNHNFKSNGAEKIVKEIMRRCTQ